MKRHSVHLVWLVPAGRCCLPSPFPRVLVLAGAEEHHLVHGEIVDGDLTRQLAHPGRHPHHPVQHDPNTGGFQTGFYIESEEEYSKMILYFF